VCITEFDHKSPNVTIPAHVEYKNETYPVRTVNTFLNGVNYLTINLTLEEGIENIEEYSFIEFRKLNSVSLPGSIRHIGEKAFRDNDFLTFNMLSSIDEHSIRNGKEIWASGEGDMNTYKKQKENIDTKKAQDDLLAENKRLQEELEKQKEELAKQDNSDNKKTKKRNNVWQFRKTMGQSR